MGRVRPAATLTNPAAVLPSCGQGQTPSFGARSQQLTIKGCRGGSRSLHRRLLRQVVCRPQTHRGVETSSGSFSTECLSGKDTLRHGDSRINPQSRTAGRLGDFTGPKRRIFSYSNRSKVQKVPSFLLERKSSTIQNPPFRTLTGALRVLQNRRGVRSVHKDPGHQVPCLPRRLAVLSKPTLSVAASNALRSSTSKAVRIQGQRRQVRPCPLTRLLIPRDGVLHNSDDSQTLCSKNDKALESSLRSGERTVLQCENNSLSPRHHGIASPPHSSGSDPKEASAETAQETVVHEQTQPRLPDTASTLDKAVGTDLEELRMAPPGCSNHPAGSSCGDIYGCIPLWLGSTHGSLVNLGTMVPIPVISPHQRPGIGSCQPSVALLPFHHPAFFSENSNRQHYSGSVCQQTGGGEVLLSVNQGGTASHLVSQAGNNSISPSRGRQAQCSGRSTQQVASDHSHRMDALPVSPTRSLDEVVQTDGGSLCLQVQPQTPNLRVSGSRTHSLEDRRSVISMDRSDSLRVPSSASHGKSHRKSKSRETKHDSHSSKSSKSAVVSKSASTHSRSSHRTSTHKQDPSSTKNGHRAFKPNGPQTSRLDAVRRRLRSSGASLSTSKFITKGLKDGSNRMYDVIWRKWCFWLKDKKDEKGRPLSPYRPPPMVIANFFAYLRDVKRLAPSYIKVHRSAINSSIAQMGVRLPENPCLTSLMKGIENDDLLQRRNRRIPAWDVFLVLAFLRLPEFSLKKISFEWLTYKTLFLVALASARRPSEWHAFSGMDEDISYESDGSIVLRFVPDFVMKTQRYNDPVVLTFIKPLTNILSPDDEDRNLCPVAFLRAYLNRSKTKRALTQRRLFISVNPNYEKDIAKPTLSRWITTVIKAAYNRKKVELPSSRAYEVRAISTSLARKHSIAMESIMESAYWRNNSTFISFYLRDTARLKGDDSHGISSLICAQSFISA